MAGNVATDDDEDTRADRFPPVYERLSFRIHKVNAQLARICNPLFRQYGVDLISSRILVLMFELGPIRAGELVEHMVLPQSTISHQIQRLEKLGYVIRDRRGTDQRVVTVTLTATGKLVAEACEKLSISVYATMVQGMEPHILELITAELDKMLSRLSGTKDG